MGQFTSTFRIHSGVAGRPLTVSFIRAAWTLAGNIATRSSASATAAGRYQDETSPADPMASSTPVNATRNPGLGNCGGTILIISARSEGTKWQTLVNANSAAIENRREPTDESAAAKPANPAMRNAAQLTSITTKGAIAGAHGEAFVYIRRIVPQMQPFCNVGEAHSGGAIHSGPEYRE
jgi:hypothetical protein